MIWRGHSVLHWLHLWQASTGSIHRGCMYICACACACMTSWHRLLLRVERCGSHALTFMLTGTSWVTGVYQQPGGSSLHPSCAQEATSAGSSCC
jgi:hypothetical protein